MKNASLLIHTDELSRSWIDRMVRHRIPTLALHPVGGKVANLSMADLLEQVAKPEYRALLDYAADKGLKIEYEMHAARYLLPADLFDSHPDWFRMNPEGERSTDWNLCASNTEALDYVAERAAEVVKQLYHSTDRYFLWLDDAKDSHCHCPACQKLSPSDQNLKIMNHIIRRLRKDNPKASLAYLAYFNSIEAPTEVTAEDGIFLEYAPFERNFHRPLTEDAQSEPLEKLLAFFGKDTAKALDYWYDNSMFSNWKKPPKAFAVEKEVLEADFAYYRSLGFEDIGCFACYLGDEYAALHGEVDISDFEKVYYK